MIKNKLAGVVTLFHPSGSVLENIETYLPDIDILYVFDNSPDNKEPVSNRLKDMNKIKYLTAGKNVGISAALNIAAENAIKNDYEYLLTMDQDSIAGEGMVSELLSVAGQNPSAGIVSPFHMVHNENIEKPFKDTEPVLTAMTSGNLLRLDVYKQAGKFLEELFIDYVDIEYCLRLSMKGFTVLRANKAVLFHTVGNLISKKFFLKDVHPSNHEPERLFFRTRNRFYIRNIYQRNFSGYFRKDISSFWREIIKILIYEKESFKKISMIYRGYMAYLNKDFSNESILK